FPVLLPLSSHIRHLHSFPTRRSSDLDTALGGPITMLRRVHWGPFEQLRLEPKDTFELFYEEKNFRSVGGFITGANPMHRGHEYIDRKSTRLNSSHVSISYAVFCLKKK